MQGKKKLKIDRLGRGGGVPQNLEKKKGKSDIEERVFPASQILKGLMESFLSSGWDVTWR